MVLNPQRNKRIAGLNAAGNESARLAGSRPDPKISSTVRSCFGSGEPFLDLSVLVATPAPAAMSSRPAT